MTVPTASQAFADAVAAIVQQDDVADTLARLLETCAELTSAAAIGLLVKDHRGRLDILSATSHQAAELELYQLQHENGPCRHGSERGHCSLTEAAAHIIEQAQRRP